MNATASLSDNSSSTTDEKLVGWVLESPDRGTLSLVISCFLTTLLCTWAVIHPRVTRNTPRRLCHKLVLFVKAIIAPEFTAVEGLQEWSQARKTVRGCKNLTEGELDLVRAFYIGMLALRYRTEQGEKIIWPNQYQWLLEQHLIDWKGHQFWGLSKENIGDKSNADTTMKAFALLQVSWFVAQSIMRAAHDLPLSQLESMTLSYVPLFVVTYFFWWAKPKDVLTPSVVDLPEMSTEQKVTFENMSVDSTFDDEHTKQQDSWWNIWKLTPRVFEKEARDRALEETAQRTTSNATEKGRSNLQGVKPKRIDEAAARGNTSLQKAATDKPSLIRSHTDIRLPVTEKPSLTRTFTKIKPFFRGTSQEDPPASDNSQRTTTQVTDISSFEPTFIEKALRRATTGLIESSQKKDCILPQHPSETVLAYWDPHVYHSKIWPITCLFGASFGALHLISWHTVFPSLVETWLWRAAAITSIVSMLIFMQYEKVVLRWGGPLTLLSILSPVVYLTSRIVMIGGVIAAFRGMDPRVYKMYVVSTYWVHLV